MRRHLQTIGLRYALRGLRVLRRADKPDAVLLTSQRKRGSVALIWALDETAEHLSAELSKKLAHLSGFETVVVVCPPRLFTALRSEGHFFETLPAPDDIRRSGVSSSWELYLRRRIARIRKNWGPDFEAVVGPEPEVYYESILNAHEDRDLS
ncbi:hypothetical protein [Labrenzia sp. 011]|uniref:hypothetical protein n=1 Tax=Labrenzia sp. 011 TaxID=2171494 RepID=UPI000D523605|nr:hypothetical protein [Labrenzia sp. 011]PVB59421.1 hypothetical protein DCO57_22510 [Labrenzia sp. 011]